MRIGFLGVLTLIFITLKLIGVIHWSWLLVLLPTILPLGLIVVTFLSLVMFVVVEATIKG